MVLFASDIPKHMRLFELIRQERVADNAARRSHGAFESRQRAELLEWQRRAALSLQRD